MFGIFIFGSISLYLSKGRRHGVRKVKWMIGCGRERSEQSRLAFFASACACVCACFAAVVAFFTVGVGAVGRAAADDGYLTPATKSTNSAFAVCCCVC
jgi:hypothetical protein